MSYSAEFFRNRYLLKSCCAAYWFWGRYRWNTYVCGAVSGGIAVLGSLYGRRKPAKESSKKAFDPFRDCFCKFRSKFGIEICGELIGDLQQENKFDSDER